LSDELARRLAHRAQVRAGECLTNAAKLSAGTVIIEGDPQAATNDDPVLLM
jgi:hypothetical protein